LAHNGHLALVYRELENYGITNYKLDENRGKHSQLKWSLRGIGNILTVPKTPSDHRAPLNLLGDLRRQLRAANLSPVPAHTKRKHLQLISNKSPAEVVERRLSDLAKDVDAVTDLLLDLAPDLARFGTLASQADTAIQNSPVKFRLQAEVPSALVGPLLAYLAANGVSMSDTRIGPLKVSTPEGPAKSAEAIRPIPPAPSILAAESAACAEPVTALKPSPIAKPKGKRHGRPFEGSAICKLMQHLRDSGPKTTTQLLEAGFTGYAGRDDRLAALAYGLVQRGLAIQKSDGSWTLTIEGKSKLKALGV
jgi:hypothetical protein